MDITYDTIKTPVPEEWIPDEKIWHDELAGSSVIHHNPDGTIEEINDSNDDNKMTRVFQFGEGNINNMGSTVGENGEYNAYFDINSDKAPSSTIHCIEERLDEIYTANDLLKDYSVDINLPEDCDEKVINLYQSFANHEDVTERYKTIRINVGGKKWD